MSTLMKEKDILANYNLPQIDILKVGHHGSSTSSTEEFIKKINPKNSIISVGLNNYYGHPTEEVLNRLNNSNIYMTKDLGNITVTIFNGKYKIKGYKKSLTLGKRLNII